VLPERQVLGSSPSRGANLKPDFRVTAQKSGFVVRRTTSRPTRRLLCAAGSPVVKVMTIG
jgi:hypothetical protein